MASDARLIQAVQRATRKLASSGNFDVLMRDVLGICVDAVGASGGTIYLHEDTTNRLRFQYVLPADIADRLPSKDIPDDFGMAGEAFQRQQTILHEFEEKLPADWNAFEVATGVQVRSMVTTPLMIEGEPPIGVVQLINKNGAAFTSSDAAVLDIVASVATMAFLNFKLSEESSRASTLLGMGKVGHDIGNLAASLHATLSAGDLTKNHLLAKHQSSPKNLTIEDCIETISPIFDDLRNSVDRIVGYAHLISDMSAGRPLRPEKRVSPLAQTIESSAQYLETDARSNHVGIRYDIDMDAPPMLHDDLYVFRIVQNLVGNAIKAVKEVLPENWTPGDPYEDNVPIFGDVTVRYCFDGELHTIEVHDCGPGMSKETIRRILSGNARSQWDKAGGSGWGTKIVLELAATHNGVVSIDSTPGKGTTFRVAFPHKVE
ncbi:MAG TPA: GAF domain-containing sensor histidine kinase [Fimbriimonas sp.]|nr:GAF domain-containing sensor histidine kinase [Fimbriimonas sp.]